MQPLDSLDRQLISALRTNARASIAELARELKVTRATVTRRLEILQKEGIIQGFAVILRTDVDASQVRAISHLAIEGPRVDLVIEALRGMPQIVRLHATNGEWDLVAELAAQNLADIDVTLTQIRKIPGVTKSETSLLLRSVLG
ncbi:MAG: Lrp/AsnC family transcriptional regulator [Buchananella hordeovulneris]|nr:Lrp/AsnC family transcriptional regulator [Buchananella hordeovulneris]